MKMVIGVLVIFLTCMTVVAEDVSSSAGYVDFGNLEKHYGEPRVQVNLSASMLGLVSSVAAHEDPQTADLISKLKQVRVSVFDIGNDSKEALSLIDKVTAKIKKDRWEPIVSVNEEGEKVRIFTKQSNGIMDGLVVMVVGDGDHGGKDKKGGKEAVFINIVGEIDPAKVGNVAKSLNIDMGL